MEPSIMPLLANDRYDLVANLASGSKSLLKSEIGVGMDLLIVFCQILRMHRNLANRTFGLIELFLASMSSLHVPLKGCLKHDVPADVARVLYSMVLLLVMSDLEFEHKLPADFAKSLVGRL
jgi:hypothetical protein